MTNNLNRMGENFYIKLIHESTSFDDYSLYKLMYGNIHIGYVSLDVNNLVCDYLLTKRLDIDEKIFPHIVKMVIQSSIGVTPKFKE